MAPAAAQGGDHRIILDRDIVAIDFRTEGGRQAGDIDHVLDADRQAVQRAEGVARHNLGLRRAGCLQHTGEIMGDQRIDRMIDGLDAGDAALGKLDG